MRKLLAIILAMSLTFSALAQHPRQIREDPSMLWAEGYGEDRIKADEEALNALVRMLSATDVLVFPDDVRSAVWKTYLADVRKCSHAVSDGPGTVIRYIEWRRIPDIFEARRRKVRELCDYSERALRKGDPATARTYCKWAQTYLSSLPREEDMLHKRVETLAAELGRGETAAVSLRNIEREVALIKGALNRRPVTSSPSAAPARMSSPHPATAQKADAEPEQLQERLVFNALSPVLPEPVATLDPPAVRLEKPFHHLSVAPAAQACPWEWRVYGLVDPGWYPSFGVRIALSRGRVGGYLSACSGVPSQRSSYSCSPEGVTPFGHIWASGKAVNCRKNVSAGILSGVTESWGVYAGVGYGDASVLWEDTTGQWARVDDLSVKGLLAEAGLTGRIRHLTWSAGLSSIRLSQCSVVLGVGWSF